MKSARTTGLIGLARASCIGVDALEEDDAADEEDEAADEDEFAWLVRRWTMSGPRGTFWRDGGGA